ncbi:unnamed protein product [Chilo suppressalis]|uniref:BTB domain-containing protein n=1 Tax=Chilo suppressalis TaxID=168631 RepID=A0ABN8LD75_CHISP|nr:unnamed protein product [Chilo suppressalis]
MFTSLLNSQTLVDVTLAAEGQQLKAHKLVLSACSTYFHSLFVDNPSRHPIVILKDVKFADLRTMVDFIYYGEVNVTEDQLPKVLDTAKMLKVKGLTEMPDSTSLTRAHGSCDARADLADPTPASPPARRKRRRQSSNGSTCIALEGERTDEPPTSLEQCRAGGGGGGAGGGGGGGDTVTLSSVPQQRRDYDDRLDSVQPTAESINVEPMGMEPNAGMAQQECFSQGGLKVRRLKNLKRQSRVAGEVAGAEAGATAVRKQASEPAPAPSTAAHTPPLLKHDSYPQYRDKKDTVSLSRVPQELVHSAVLP